MSEGLPNSYKAEQWREENEVEQPDLAEFPKEADDREHLENIADREGELLDTYSDFEKRIGEYGKFTVLQRFSSKYPSGEVNSPDWIEFLGELEDHMKEVIKIIKPTL